MDNTVRLWDVEQIEEEEKKEKRHASSRQSQLLSQKEIEARNYFQLSLNNNVNHNELRTKYKEEALSLHPDKRKNRNTTEDFKELRKHYDVLINDSVKKQKTSIVFSQNNLNKLWNNQYIKLIQN